MACLILSSVAGCTFSRTTPRVASGEVYHIREIGIQRQEHATILNSEAEDFFVAGA